MKWNWIILLSADCCQFQQQKVCESVKNCFQLIYLNFSGCCIALCCLVQPIRFGNILRKWFMTTVLTLPTCPATSQNLYGFSVMIQKQFFRVFQLFSPEVRYFYQKTLERIRKSYLFSGNDLKHEITMAKNLLRKESKLPISPEQCFFHLQLVTKLCLIVTGSSNSSRHQRFMREKFFKNKICENISQKFHYQCKIG